MTDLEKLAAEAAKRAFGVVVSHDQAALLREVERMMSAVRDAELCRSIDGSWFVSIAAETSECWRVAEADTLTAALQSALDAAGVPDTARMGEKA